MTEGVPHEEGSLGEVRAQVRGLTTSFDNLGRRLDEGLKGVSDLIREQGNRFDQRINDQVTRTDKRFEDMASANLQALGGKSAQTWQVFIFIGGAVISLATLGATFYSITRAPIDSNFSRIEGVQSAYATMLAELHKEIDTKIEKTEAKFVPRGEVAGFVKSTNEELYDLSTRMRVEEAGGAGRNARLDGIDRRLAAQSESIREDRNNGFTKAEAAGLSGRVNAIENRVQTVYDKAYSPSAPPSSPPPVAGAPLR